MDMRPGMRRPPIRSDKPARSHYISRMPKLPPITAVLIAAALPAPGNEAERLFVEQVRPLLASKCLACHGDDAEKIKGDLDMRSRAGLLRGGESGRPALVPGEPDRSPLFVAVTWKDEDLEMPPKENDRLAAEQIEVLRRWIAAGAPWSDVEAGPVATDPAGTWSEPDDKGTVRIATSKAENQAWANRRYALDDLWAYRPRPDMAWPARKAQPDGANPIDMFVATRVATRQLPTGSQNGLAVAGPADEAVLRRRLAYTLTGLPPDAAQAALPCDQLIDHLLDSPHYGERMAQHWLDVTRFADSNGFSRDEFRPEAHRYRSYVIGSFQADKPIDRFIREQIAGDELGLAGQEALGFLWAGPWEMTSMTSAAVARQMWLDDVVNSVGVTFLGQELRCAKCHDHKFDPIPTRDYYALQAVFAATKHSAGGGKFRIQPQAPQKISILKGGSLEDPVEPVAPGLLSALPMTRDHPVPTGAAGRRAALANWIADPENPFTARVFVNRVWQWHFGRGLVGTPNGFGVMGEKPSHPRLLDWLANWFVEHGWSLRELNRLILTSETWRRRSTHPDPGQLAALDPDNRLLSVFPMRRLSAEEIRDSMLVVSGQLNRRVGGPGFKAKINWEVAHQPRLTMGKLAPPWEPEPKRAERHRRSIYAIRIRNLGHPLMEVLNRPDSGLSCPRRDETTVVTQSFSLFHGEFVRDRALAAADRVRRATKKPDAGQGADPVTALFETILQRAPTPSELAPARAHYGEMLAHHQAHPPTPNKLPTEVAMPTVAEKTGESEIQRFALKSMAKYERELQPWQVDAETRALAELALVLLNTSEFLHVK